MMSAIRMTLLTGALLAMSVCITAAARGNQDAALGLTIDWSEGYLTIHGDFPGIEIPILYLEAYCRAGSTDRDWGETVIGHQSEVVDADDAGKRIRLRDRLIDGVIVEHEITAGVDEVDFRLIARNPTNFASQAHWAQPCIRVGGFTGCTTDDARALVPEYARHCFIFINGRLTRLPTTPWAEQARYVPGQVYRPAHIDPDDVNPRPVSQLTPSNGLIG
jgi:hypothetical protein